MEGLVALEQRGVQQWYFKAKMQEDEQRLMNFVLVDPKIV
jgi:hypothetical protein